MGKKRKQEQRRDYSSSSDEKRCRSWQNGETSRRSDHSEFAFFLFVTQDKLSKLERKIVKLEKNRQKDKEVIEELRIKLVKLEKEKEKGKQDIEELKGNFQEMRKEGSAKVQRCNASPSQRSLGQTTRFRLVIKSRVSSPVYKGKTVRTDNSGGHIEVVMYDGCNPIESDHPFASITVELVVIEGGFNEPKRTSWSKEDFEKSIIKPRQGNTRLVKNGTFDLIGGSHVHKGAIITENSNRKEIKLGVMIGVPTEERVLEGVSNPFKVQEAKTEKHVNNKESSTDDTTGDKRLSYPPGQAQQVQMQILSQPTSTTAMQHGHGLVTCGEQHSLPPPIMQNPLQTIYAQTAANRDGPVGQITLDCGQQQYTSYYNASAHWQNTPFLDLPEDSLMSWPSITEGHHPSAGDVHHLDAQTQNQVMYGSLRIGQVLLLWDKPDVELRQRWNLLDQLMPLYTRHSSICSGSFPSTSLMDKVHMLLSSSSPGDSVVKMMRGLGITSVTSRAMQTPRKRGILIRPIEPYYSYDKPPVKRQRHAKYQLRFVNRACNDYYTWDFIKSDDGNFLKVALYDENNTRITAGLLSSASVEVVLLHGDFNADGQDYWTSEEFNSCIPCTYSGKERPALGGDLVMVLIDGEANLGTAFFRKTSFHARTGKFKMGVRMKINLEDRVQEGITESFIVRNRPAAGLICNSKSSLGELSIAPRFKMENFRKILNMQDEEDPSTKSESMKNKDEEAAAAADDDSVKEKASNKSSEGKGKEKATIFHRRTIPIILSERKRRPSGFGKTIIKQETIPSNQQGLRWLTKL